MTEKRYSMKGSTIFEDGEEITYWDCCDLLNGLNDENEELKKENNELKEQFNRLRVENQRLRVELYEKELQE